jgi:ribosomal-protein-alanine N-acetyltransferase
LGVIWAIRLIEEPTVVGDIGYNPNHDHNAEISFKLHHELWNHGHITEPLLAVVEFVFRHTAAIRIEAMARPENVASLRVLEKAGFATEGIMRSCEHFEGRSYDMAMHSLLVADE